MNLVDIVRHTWPDLIVFACGLYKGYMNASGVEVDSTYLIYAIGGRSVLNGIGRGARADVRNKEIIKIKEANKQTNQMLGFVSPTVEAFWKNAPDMKEKKPSAEAMHGVVTGVIGSSFEIGLGYGVGWLAYKIFN